MAASFETMYPNIAWWVEDGGWIELGRDDYSRSMIRVLDIGGMVWEGKDDYKHVSEALDEAENAIGKWMEKNGY